MHKHANIKSWSEEDRPREKLLIKGQNALSDAELVAILMGSGNRDETSVELARRILKSVDNNLNELSKLSIKDLMKFKGVGEVKAINIISALELGRRRREADGIKKEKIGSSNDVYLIFSSFMEDIKCEEFWILLLNKGCKILGKYKVSLGGTSGTFVDTKVIFKLAIENLAASIILCHNHPSGNLFPSKEDINLTKKLTEAGKIFDISVLDHIIITDAGYYSFADDGKI